MNNKDYKIVRVSEKEPREWSFTDKRTGQKVQMVSYRVMLEGETDAIEVNRKPGDKPTVGEVLTGTVENSEYGKRFKPARKPFAPTSQKDNSEIRAEWAIGQAVQINTDGDLGRIESVANELFKMVDRVKTGTAAATSSLSDKFREWKSGKAAAPAPAKHEPVAEPEEDTVYPVNDEEEINLDDIPF